MADEHVKINGLFSSFEEYMKEDQDIREEIRVCVRNIEQTEREILAVLQGVHQKPEANAIMLICNKAKDMFGGVRKQYGELIAKIPAGQYYRFHDHWRFANQRLAFMVAFVDYLENETLVTREQVAEYAGIHTHRDQGFHIDLDDFLMGLLQMASELSRLAVNSVTTGDYSRPVGIAAFVSELDSGFRLLNLKNDSLRKRFDGLKYDMKKIEEVVYDITIRGLKPT